MNETKPKTMWPDTRRHLLAKDQLDNIVRHHNGLWHFDSGLNRFYYATPTPERVEHYVGYTHQGCHVLGTNQITNPPI